MPPPARSCDSGSIMIRPGGRSSNGATSQSWMRGQKLWSQFAVPRTKAGLRCRSAPATLSTITRLRRRLTSPRITHDRSCPRSKPVPSPEDRLAAHLRLRSLTQNPHGSARCISPTTLQPAPHRGHGAQSSPCRQHLRVSRQTAAAHSSRRSPHPERSRHTA